MANSEQYLLSPNPFTLNNANNSFVSNWGDKRSGSTFGVSLVFYTSDGYVPDGYAWLEVSNAPMQAGSGYGQPANGGDDATEYAGSQQTIALNTITNLYSVQWQVSGCGAHFVRVRYTPTESVAGLTCNVYLNVPFTSQ